MHTGLRKAKTLRTSRHYDLSVKKAIIGSWDLAIDATKSPNKIGKTDYQVSAKRQEYCRLTFSISTS